MSEHAPQGGRTRASRSAAAWRFAAASCLGVLCVGLAAALAGAPAERAAIAGGAVACLVAAHVFARRRDLNAIDAATRIAARFAAGERNIRLPRARSPELACLADALNGAADSIAVREAQFALLAQAAGDTFWDWDLDTNAVACTHGGKMTFGAEADAFVVDLGWWMQRIHLDDRDAIDAHAAEIRSGAKDRWSVEYRFLHADAAYHWVWDRGVVVAAGGRPARVVGCMTDISARKQAEEMLQHVERRQRALITAVSSITWRDDLYAPTQPRNLAWEEYTGQTQAEEFGEGWLNAVHAEDRDTMLSAWSGAMANGSVYRADMRLRRRDGTYRWMSARGAPVRDKTGKIVEYIGLYEDVDDYYAAREELRLKTLALGQRIKEMRCLHAITVVCNCDELTVAKILTDVALVLPSALVRSEAGACRIEWRGEAFRSPNYLDPVVATEVAIKIDSETAGRIVLGYSDRVDGDAMQPEEIQLLRTAGNLVMQMLARRKDWLQLERQSQELWRRQAMFEQTERLARVGGWEYGVASRSFTCSREVRRIADKHAVSANRLPTGDGVPAFLADAVEEAVETREAFDRELAWELPDGTRRWLHAVGQLQIVDGEPVRVFGIVKDITNEKEAHGQALHMANHDALTGLPNRRFFAAKLDSELARADELRALLLVDLDHFKEVNDTLGHDVGDHLLRVVSERLQAAAGAEATVARLGGDEFAVLAEVADRPAARALAERVLSQLRGPVNLAGQPGLVACSAGLAVSPRDGPTATELLKNADIALYSGKSRGRGAFVTYAPHLRRNIENRIAICAEVRDCLNADQFAPFYQPKISLKTGALCGFEALLRWLHPSGIRTPATIMPAFDDHDLAMAIHTRMMEGIIRDMTAWRDAGLQFDHVAVNTAAAQFTGFDVADDVLGRLRAAGLPPSSFGIELTETVLLGRDAETVGPTLRKLHEAGVSIALDDFGTGYASLTHLQQYPVNIIKIDQSFIRAIGVDSGSQAITSALLGLGRNLNMTVVAEGVENVEQADLLRLAGCDQAQGFFFARPIPAAAVPGYVAGLQAADAAEPPARTQSAA